MKLKLEEIMIQYGAYGCTFEEAEQKSEELAKLKSVETGQKWEVDLVQEESKTRHTIVIHFEKWSE